MNTMENQRKLILYIAMSLDGYIAKPNDDLSFLELVACEGEDYGYAEFLNSIDTVILGRKTYDWVMTQVPEFPHADLDTYVISRTARPSIGKTEFYIGNISNLVSELKCKAGKNIFIDGGAELVNSLLKEKLINELIISIIPILLGKGIRLFQEGFPEQNLKLISSKQFDSGLLQTHYQILK
jgi:dihydrofolate reductase